MPPYGKPPINPGHPAPSMTTSYTHSEQMSAANKKHYEPLAWDLFFDELSYLDNVKFNLSTREHLLSEQVIKEH